MCTNIRAKSIMISKAALIYMGLIIVVFGQWNMLKIIYEEKCHNIEMFLKKKEDRKECYSHDFLKRSA
jgi:hypothetical protein